MFGPDDDLHVIHFVPRIGVRSLRHTWLPTRVTRSRLHLENEEQYCASGRILRTASSMVVFPGIPYYYLFFAASEADGQRDLSSCEPTL